MTRSPDIPLPPPKERRRLRESASLTRAQLAAQVGVTSDTVRGWETGRSAPRGRKGEKYASLLKSLGDEPVVTPAQDEPGVREAGVREGAAGGEASADVVADVAADAVKSEEAGAVREGSGRAAIDALPRASATDAPGAGASPDQCPADAPPASTATGAAAASPSGAATHASTSAATGPVASDASDASRTVTTERKRAAGGDRGRFPFTRRRRGAAAPDRSRGPVPERPHTPAPDRGHTPGTDHDHASARDHGHAHARAHAPHHAPARDHAPVRDYGPRTGRDGERPAVRGHGHGPGQHRRPAAVTDGDRPAAPDGHRAAVPDRDRPPLLERGPAHTRTAVPRRPDGAAGALTPAESFDALYAFCAPALVRQTYLLTGRRDLARESVERAFQQAWQRWPEVARDPDPAGWVRSAAYEWALSPWHRLRPRHRHPEPPPSDALDRTLMDTLLHLPPAYRRALVLYDGVGLGLPETAAETEASTRATVNRLAHAREAVAERLPELADPEVLHWRLVELASTERLRAAKPPVVRHAGERQARFWTRAAIAFTVALIGSTALTLHTAPRRYEPPVPPGETVQGVPPPVAPGPLSESERELRAKLRKQPQKGPERLLPQPR
ncbi:helix-turn-helix domain-containing protein [Streptomyces sp. NPDC003456]|uniref:helix-turn-helix domain-containing protein n=1 Tax=Streptomyces sp. NPDC003456 TaxID=3364683 RepID=UPI0036B48DEA